MKVGDLVRIKNTDISSPDNYLGIITEKMDENGCIVYFFSGQEYYGYDTKYLELVNE